MKKIILFFVALILLIGAGIGGYIFFDAKKDDHAKVEEKKKPTGPPQFVQIEGLILPVIGNRRVEQNVLLSIALEVGDEETRDKVRAVTPRLKDAYIRALYGSIGKDQVIEGQIINVANLEQKLLEATESVVGKDVVQGVLVQNVSQRPAF